MRVWIDATHHDADLAVFGMSLIERALRALLDAQSGLRRLEQAEARLQELSYTQTRLEEFLRDKMRPKEVRIELAQNTEIPALDPSLLQQLPITWSQSDRPVRDRLQRFLEEAKGEAVIALPADAVIDGRVVEHLVVGPDKAFAFQYGEGHEASAIMRFIEPMPDSLAPDATSLADIAAAALDSGRAVRLAEDQFDTYVSKLRRDLPPYLLRVHDAATRHKAERFLFWSNYKGSTDFMTKYVYPPLVWLLVRPLARRRIPPNWVTSVGIVATFASVPFCAAGAWVPGLALAYLMSVLDSVDGKLARFTFTSSKQGDVLDHGTDIVHPPIWYFAWAWGLSGGDPFSPIFTASVWIAGLYILDRIMEVLFKSCTGRSIHAYTPLDVRMRTFVSRRNVNLPIFTVGLLLGVGEQAFYLIAVWQGLTALFHLTRVIKFWNVLEAQKAAERAHGIAATVVEQ